MYGVWVRPLALWFIVFLTGKLIADCPQRVPTVFSCYRSTVAALRIQVDPASCAQSPAVFPAKHERRHCEQPCFPDRRFQIECRRVCIESVDIRIVAGVFTFR